MGDRKVVLFKKWPMASVFAVLAIAASAVLGPHAAAQSCAAVDLVPANLTDVSAGSADLVAHIAYRAAACPDEQFILAGYSLGAGVVHAALGTGIVAGLPGVVQLPGYLVDRVAVVLLFGDPLRSIGWSVPDRYSDRTADFCAAGDPVCGAGTDPGAHARYGDFIGAAVGFSAAHL